MLTLVLPYPISANRYWASFVPPGSRIASVYVSTEAKRYKKDLQELCTAGGLKEPIKGRVRAVLKLYPNRPLDWQKRVRQLGEFWDDSVMCLDLANADKVLCDALNGIAWVDDGRIFDFHLKRMTPDDGGARVVLEIEAITDNWHGKKE